MSLSYCHLGIVNGFRNIGEIYEPLFDCLFSVYDTKKLSSNANREEETEFGLQRAETGDRRLNQNNQIKNNNGANDLRAAHSSDFFSGQRERGRDESAPPAPAAAPARPAQSRQSFRRATTPRATSPTTQYTTPPPPPPPQPSSPSQYEVSKRKLVRKRPVYTSPAPTFPPNNPPQQSYNEPQQSYKEQPQQPYKQQPFKQQQPQQPYKQQQPQQPYKQQQQQQSYKDQPQQPFKQQRQQNQQQNFQNLPPKFQAQPQNRPDSTTPDVPPQYREFKDEYVEVSRVTPKPNRYYPSNPTPLPSSYATQATSQFNKKNGLTELYNYDAQSTPGLNVQQNDNGQFKVKNNFSVDVPREDFARTRSQNNFNNGGKQQPTTTIDYSAATRPVPTTQSYKNFNSVSYEPEKNNFVPFSKQNYYNPTTTPPAITTAYTTVRPEPPQNLNTVAYNTNIGFHSQSNFANPDEDDGQYRPPQGEDDGQYRPELYERELLAGAHSLNIAASGNRLPEDQQKKSYSKTQPPPKFTSQTAAPRPFRPAPTPTSPPRQTTNAPEYTTTVVPQTQRVFDLFQTYTTTSRPSDLPGGAPDFVPINNGPVRPPTTVAPRAPETRPPRPAQAPTFPPAPAPRPTNRPQPAAKPNKEDASYDYAYYDSDPGFTEYDHIEEFGRTKKRA